MEASMEDVEQFISRELHIIMQAVSQAEIVDLRQRINEKAEIITATTNEKTQLEKLLVSQEQELDKYKVTKATPVVITISDSPIETLVEPEAEPETLVEPEAELVIMETELSEAQCLYMHCKEVEEKTNGYCKMHANNYLDMLNNKNNDNNILLQTLELTSPDFPSL